MGEGLKRARDAARATRQPVPEVHVGSIWADNDSRSAGRTLRVDFIVGGEDDTPGNGAAICTILTNTAEAQERSANYDGSFPRPADRRQKTTRISLSRFRPTSTGYRLIRDQQYGIRWPTGSVFAFRSRGDAEAALAEDGRGIGVLVVHEYEPGTSNATEWREVDR